MGILLELEGWKKGKESWKKKGRVKKPFPKPRELTLTLLKTLNGERERKFFGKKNPKPRKEPFQALRNFAP